ncbi:MAG TPA: DUF4912 domain-containing protein [Polyangia bacterium]|nr:DUF4912 domain-containing protein [Polyangia bacterium]
MTSEVELASQILVIVGQKPDARLPSFTADELFQQATRKQLLDCAQTLGLTGVSKLVKEELAGRVKTAFDGLRAAIARTQSDPAASRKAGPAQPVDVTGSLGYPATPEVDPAQAELRQRGPENGPTALPSKFDLGPQADTEPMPANIPWGYDQNRVTAMVVDPERLYVYWEVTDDGVAAARKSLGRGGETAWLNLRVYDITGRLFDGTNAHSYFDHRIELHDRQWFFAINKPTSSACVEVGLKSDEGYFVKVARSGRVDFPRREPAPGGAVEWLTVRAGNVAYAASPQGPLPAGGDGGGGGGSPGGGDAPNGGPGPGGGGWSDWSPGHEGFPVPVGHRVFNRRWDWQEATGTAWTGELTRSEWIGPLLRTEWEAGPFTYPIEIPSSVEVHDGGEMSVRTEHGQVHVVYGPWQVVIRGIGARAQRRVLGTWEFRRQIAVSGGAERFGTMTGSTNGTYAPGSSEWMALGSSERAWMGSSELLFGGASELWLMGASETRLGGSSELMYSGASELRMRGASERMFAGATERLFRGSSERIAGGASEQMLAGASERRLGGGSENARGASERMYGASERLAGGSEGRLGVPTPSSDYPLPAYAPPTGEPSGD